MRLRVAELNTVIKDWRKVKVKVGLCYPNVYRAGMTGLTIQLLYYLFNSHDDVVCERFFKLEGEPLSLESNKSLRSFDLLAFTFQYELDYVGFLEMLIKSGVPLDRKERAQRGGPVIIAGGPAVWANPCVLEDYVDVFAIGEAEPLVNTLIGLFKECRDRESFLEAASRIDGLYVPSFSRGKVKGVIVNDLNASPHPISQVVTLGPKSSTPIFGKVFNLEATRSCSRGCRFCLICWLSRPIRHRGLQLLKHLIDEGVAACNVDKVAMIGAGFSDHPRITELLSYVVESGLKLSVPSIRGDILKKDVFEALVKGGQRTLTIAPEAGNERLREVIGKPISDDTILKVCEEALDAGIRRLKLYFMVGLPGERREDVEDVIKLVDKLCRRGFLNIHVTVGPLIPKAQTPFQWLPLARREVLAERYKVLSKLSRLPRVRVDLTALRLAELQALVSMGDRCVGRVLAVVAKMGGRLGTWRSAIKSLNLDLDAIVYGDKPLDSSLPWDFIYTGPQKHYLTREYEKAVSLAS